MSGSGDRRWFVPGDVNAFFGLMFDNMTNLVILAGILVGVFGYPPEVVLYKMVPGTAVGVMVGDLVYTWMAIRLARRLGRADVCAMPLGIDTPSLFGLSFGLLGPAFLAAKGAGMDARAAADHAWKVGMAVMVVSGVFKCAASTFGLWVRRVVPRAALLGSIAGVALALIMFLPALEIWHEPEVGLVSLGVILVSLVARYRMPRGVPGAFVAVAAGCAVAAVLGALGGHGAELHRPELRLAIPWPTLGFLEGLSDAAKYLPLAIPFALATVIGGIDVTESAAAAGDEYDTRAILLTEGVATLAAGLTGGVVQTTPYIGHPAYKDMGGRAGYTLLTALFIGLGGMLGFLQFVVDLLPKAAVAPIIVFIGVEITAQAFVHTKREHAQAVAFSFLPTLAALLAIQFGQLLPALGKTAADIQGPMAESFRTIAILGNGFILTSLLWGGALAHLIDHKLRDGAAYVALCAAASLFGLIHSPLPGGDLFLPWRIDSDLPVRLAVGYALMAGAILAVGAASPAGKRSA